MPVPCIVPPLQVESPVTVTLPVPPRTALPLITLTTIFSAGKTVTVGGRQQEATKVSRRDGDKEQILWVVDGLPVPTRILQRKDGEDEMDLRLKSIQ